MIKKKNTFICDQMDETEGIKISEIIQTEKHYVV